MRVQVIQSRFVPGRVLVGPKIVGDGYYRIVSQDDRSGRIEAYDPRCRSWEPAPDHITFHDLWSAPSAPLWSLDLAAAPASDFDDEDVSQEASEGSGHADGGPDFTQDTAVLEPR